jgi:hypothetical protein
MAKMTYDEDADVLYVSFGQSEHVTGVELAVPFPRFHGKIVVMTSPF